MSVVSASFRTRVRAGVEPIARVFGRVGLTPNALTVIGLLIAVVGAYFAAVGSWLVAGVVVAFGAIFDLFDGALARATGKVSKFGAFLDSTLDRAGEGVVYIGIAIGCIAGDFAAGAVLAVAAMAAGYMVSYSRSRAESVGFSSGSGMASVGLAPREVRMVILVVGLLLTGIAGGVDQGPWLYLQGYELPFGYFIDTAVGKLWIQLSLYLITTLATITAIQRILFTYNQSRSQNQEVNH